MTARQSRVLFYDAHNDNPFGPGRIEDRTAQAGFTRLGTYVLDLPDGGHADEWTLQYEETVYVAKGQASIVVVAGEGESELTGHEGDIIALVPGDTVRYGGAPGTRLILSIAPADWRTRTTPKVLFLTPFHFEQGDHDDEFDAVLTQLMAGKGEADLVAAHVRAFEADDPDYDAAQAVAVVEAVERANTEDYDAVVIACHYDPALAEARAASAIPVVGPLQLCTAVTTQYGPKFAVITDIAEAEEVIAGLVAGYGHAEACTAVTSIGWEGDAILDDPRGAAQAVDRIVAELAGRGEVQSIVIGCTIVSSAYERHRHEFEDHGVVVLNTNLLALKGAATLASN
jgi:Asp/Glu/hydantoin racemase